MSNNQSRREVREIIDNYSSQLIDQWKIFFAHTLEQYLTAIKSQIQTLDNLKIYGDKEIKFDKDFQLYIQIDTEQDQNLIQKNAQTHLGHYVNYKHICQQGMILYQSQLRQKLSLVSENVFEIADKIIETDSNSLTENIFQMTLETLNSIKDQLTLYKENESQFISLKQLQRMLFQQQSQIVNKKTPLPSQQFHNQDQFKQNTDLYSGEIMQVPLEDSSKHKQFTSSIQFGQSRKQESTIPSNRIENEENTYSNQEQYEYLQQQKLIKQQEIYQQSQKMVPNQFQNEKYLGQGQPNKMSSDFQQNLQKSNMQMEQIYQLNQNQQINNQQIAQQETLPINKQQQKSNIKIIDLQQKDQKKQMKIISQTDNSQQ